MNKDETLKLALEALEINLVFLKNVKPFKGQEDLASDCVLMSEETITAIKEALAKEKALQALHDENERLGLYKDAYAQPEQEPVAYDKTELNCFAQDLYDQKMREGRRGHYESMFHVIHQCIKKVAPQPEQEPQIAINPETVGYVAPQRKPLTDEHPLVVFAKECVLGAYKESELGDAARRAIEAAYNIKGEA